MYKRYLFFKPPPPPVVGARKKNGCENPKKRTTTRGVQNSRYDLYSPPLFSNLAILKKVVLFNRFQISDEEESTVSINKTSHHRIQLIDN